MENYINWSLFEIKNRPFDPRISDVFIGIPQVNLALSDIYKQSKEVKKEIKQKKESDKICIIDIENLFKEFKKVVKLSYDSLNRIIDLYNEELKINVKKIEFKDLELPNYKLGCVKETRDLIKYIQEYCVYLIETFEKFKNLSKNNI